MDLYSMTNKSRSIHTESSSSISIGRVCRDDFEICFFFVCFVFSFWMEFKSVSPIGLFLLSLNWNGRLNRMATQSGNDIVATDCSNLILKWDLSAFSMWATAAITLPTKANDTFIVWIATIPSTRARFIYARVFVTLLRGCFLFVSPCKFRTRCEFTIDIANYWKLAFTFTLAFKFVDFLFETDFGATFLRFSTLSSLSLIFSLSLSLCLCHSLSHSHALAIIQI